MSVRSTWCPSGHTSRSLGMTVWCLLRHSMSTGLVCLCPTSCGHCYFTGASSYSIQHRRASCTSRCSLRFVNRILGSHPTSSSGSTFLHSWGGGSPHPQVGSALIQVKKWKDVIPYFQLPMLESMKGWRKHWFYLKNDNDYPFPPFIGRRLEKTDFGGTVFAGMSRRSSPLC
jgi:hypothetical protein